MSTDSPIFNIHDVELNDWSGPGDFDAQVGHLASNVGAKKLGYNITVVPPGKKAFPYHYHSANEEMFLILEGSGNLRYDGKEYPIKQGDVIAAPPGPDSAHQIINDSDAELKYLALSTKEPVELAGYPDSGKFGVASVNADGSVTRKLFVEDDSINYWQGEE